MPSSNQTLTLALFDDTAAKASLILALGATLTKRSLKPSFKRASTVDRQLQPLLGVYYEASIRPAIYVLRV